MDTADWLRRQRALLEPIARAIEADHASCTEGDPNAFERTLLAWRRASAAAALDSLDSITGQEPQS